MKPLTKYLDGEDRTAISEGPCVLLVAGALNAHWTDNSDDGAKAKSLYDAYTAAVEAELPEYTHLEYFVDNRDPRDQRMMARFMAKWMKTQGIQPDECAIVITRDSTQYVCKAVKGADDIAGFIRRFKADEVEAYVKSGEPPPKMVGYPYKPESCQFNMAGGHAEPFLAGVTRVTTKTWDQVVMDPKKDVFVQEFADWCPFCVFMHPWTNDLGWVLSATPNVYVAKIDNVDNDVTKFKPWLAGEGIPNLRFLGSKTKKARREGYHFGSCGEDPGPVPERLKAMVRIIHRHMENEKFDEDELLLRAELISGTKDDSFLAQTGWDGERTWLELIRGDIETEMGEYKTYRGAKAAGPDGKLADKPWREAFKQAGCCDKHAPHKIWKDKAKVTSFDLVMAKFEQQLHRECKSDQMKHDAAYALMIEAKEVADAAATTNYHVGNKFIVYFHARNVRITAINTAQETFQACFEIVLKWKMSLECHAARKTKGKEQEAFEPPELQLINASDSAQFEGLGSVLHYQKIGKDGSSEMWTSKTLVYKATFMEGLELHNFPFDVQPLQMKLQFRQDRERPWKLERDPEEMVMSFDTQAHTLTEWSILNDQFVVEIFDQNFSSRQKDGPKDSCGAQQGLDDARTAVIMRVIAKRGWARYLWSIAYIMAALGLAGSPTFLLDPVEELGDRMAIYLTLLLASVAFQVVIEDRLPNLSYISYLEGYVISMNLLLLLGCLECHISASQEWEEDFFWVYVNAGLWLLIHVCFAALTIFRVIPSENSKLVRLTDPTHMISDRVCDTKYNELVSHQATYEREQVQVHGKKTGNYLAVFPTQAIKDRGENEDKALLNQLPKKSGGSPLPSSSGARVAPTESKVSDVITCNGNGDILKKGNDPECADGICRRRADRMMSNTSCKVGNEWWRAKVSDAANEAMGSPRDEMQRLWPEIFRKIDEDGNGTLSSNEIQATAGKLYDPIYQLIDEMRLQTDNDHDEFQISRTQWEGYFGRMCAKYGAPSPGAVELLRSLVAK